MFQPDFTRRQQAAEQHIQDMQQEAARQRPDPDDPRASEPARFVISAPLVLGLIILLLAIISCVGFFQLR